MHATARRFIVDFGWQVLLKDLGLNAQDLLRHARLPLDLFARDAPSLTAEEYFRLWASMEHFFDDPAFPLRLGQSISVEAFSPPIFACFCSDNLQAALHRLAQYKPLIGPMTLTVEADRAGTSVVFGGLRGGGPVPPSLIATELVFLVHLARLATRERIEPIGVYASLDLPAAGAYEEFLGSPIIYGDIDGLTFSARDAHRPFLTANEKMWSVFEPELRKRVADLNPKSSFRERVRACLIETIAGGHCKMADVAARLTVSERTLQRRLQDEGTNFQQELNALREELARHYLTHSRHSSSEIAFLLGYDDPNSFIRAFHLWTGKTPESMRASSLH